MIRKALYVLIVIHFLRRLLRKLLSPTRRKGFRNIASNPEYYTVLYVTTIDSMTLMNVYIALALVEKCDATLLADIFNRVAAAAKPLELQMTVVHERDGFSKKIGRPPSSNYPGCIHTYLGTEMCNGRNSPDGFRYLREDVYRRIYSEVQELCKDYDVVWTA